MGIALSVTREFAADLETPVSVYIKLMDEPGASFLLESVEGGEQVGRYSFIGVNPRATLTLRGRTVERQTAGSSDSQELAGSQDILDRVKAELGRFHHAAIPGLPRFAGGAVGYLGYDVVRFFERLPATAESVLDLPDARFAVRWFDPRNGGELQAGSIESVEGGDRTEIGDPPGEPGKDWVALLRVARD